MIPCRCALRTHRREIVFKLRFSRRGIRVCFADIFGSPPPFVSAPVVFTAVLRPNIAVVAPIVRIRFRPLPQLLALHRLVAQRPPAPGATLALFSAPLTKTNILFRFAIIWFKPTPAKQASPFQFHNGASSWDANAPKRRLPNAIPESKEKMAGFMENCAAAGVGNLTPPLIWGFYNCRDLGNFPTPPSSQWL